MNVNGLHGPEDGNHQYEEEGRPFLERRAIELASLFHSRKNHQIERVSKTMLIELS
jgi:hypothetical protein